MSEEEEMTPVELKVALENVRDALKRANAESADRRKKLEVYEAEKKELKDKSLSNSEKFQVEIKAVSEAHKTLKAELHAERVRNAVTTEAQKLGFASPDDAYALTDLSEIDITDGKVVGFEKSLKALAESGRLVMADQKRGDSLGTPLGKGKPASGAEKAPVQIRV